MKDPNTFWYRTTTTLLLGLLLFACQVRDTGIDVAESDRERIISAADRYLHEEPVRHPFLLFGGLALSKPEYIALWKTLDPDPQVAEVIRNFPFRQPILWID